MYKVHISDFDYSICDLKLRSKAICADIDRAEKTSCIYYCPSDATGLDGNGAFIRSRKSSEINIFLNGIASHCSGKKSILVFLGFKDFEDNDSCAVIYDGEVLCISNVNKQFSIDISPDIRIGLLSVSSYLSCFSRNDCELMLLFGSVEFWKTSSSDLRAFLDFSSKNSVCAIYYKSGLISNKANERVYESEEYCFNYFDSNSSKLVDIKSLKYLKKILLKNEKVNCDFNIECKLKEYESYKFESLPLVNMEGEMLMKCFELVSENLANRMKNIGLSKIIVGLSGGIDSLSALLIARRALHLLSIPCENLIAVSMPGPGSSEQTKENIRLLSKAIPFTFLEIPIIEAVKSHLSDIGHSGDIKDIVYENAQARERTQILLNLANKYKALQIGTSDFSESFIGWCTYGGDQLSMFNVNLTFSKTQLIEILKNIKEKTCENVIRRIISTPISPELIPPNVDGTISQKTEENVGPYEVLDFFIYLFIYRGYDVKSCIDEACRTFDGKYLKKDIENWIIKNYKRFLSSSFKRQTSAIHPIATKIDALFATIDIPSSLS